MNINFRGIRSTYITRRQKVWHFTFCFTIIYDAFFLHRWINIFMCIYGHFDFADLIAWLKIPRYLFSFFFKETHFQKKTLFLSKSCFFDFIQNRTFFVFIKNRSFFQRCSALQKLPIMPSIPEQKQLKLIRFYFFKKKQSTQSLW